MIGLIGTFVLMLGHAFTSAVYFLELVFYMIDIKHVYFFIILDSFINAFISYFLFYIYIIYFNFPGTINFIGDLLLLFEAINISITFLIINFFGYYLDYCILYFYIIKYFWE